jgi:dynamin 1-like protein
MDTLNEATVAGQMRELIQLIDQLRDINLDPSIISLPRLVVMGLQSSGKSSLIESLVGFDFLPRGEGVVTRRPLELRLIRVTEKDDQGFQPYAVFDGVAENKKYFDFAEVRKVIEAKTNEVAGSKKNIVKEPIIMRIYSNKCLDLSLVDLPGITKIQIQDQGKDIEAVTKEMTLSYIKNPRTIILCVIPANADLSTSDALKLAMDIDENGQRTIGVLTKADIMDKGTDCKKILRNEEIKLHHGYVAVKNRSQLDINNNVAVETALESEKKYFEANYAGMLDRVGTEVLSKRLSTLLYQQIKDNLGKINDEIISEITKNKNEMVQLGEALPKSDSQKMSYVIGMLKKLVKEYQASMNIPQGNSKSKDAFSVLTTISLWIKDINTVIKKDFLNAVAHTDYYELCLDIMEARKLSLPGFYSEEAFQAKLRTEIEKLKAPCRAFITKIQTVLEKTIKVEIDKLFHYLPSLRTLISQKAKEFLMELTDDTSKFIEELIECEQMFIYTNDQDYVKPTTSSKDPTILTMTTPAMSPQKSGMSTAKDTPLGKYIEYGDKTLEKIIKKKYVDQVKALKTMGMDINSLVKEEEVAYFVDRMTKYYEIVTRNLSDTIPKIIIAKLVFTFEKKLDENLTEKLISDPNLCKLVVHDPDIEKRRERCHDSLRKLQKAKEVLDSTINTQEVKMDNFENISDGDMSHGKSL